MLAPGKLSNEDLGEEEIDDMIDSLQIMKLKKAGKYSARYRNRQEYPSCNRCNASHEPHRCPANGKECFSCGGRNHFSGSKICLTKKPNEDKETPFSKVKYNEDNQRYDTAKGATKRI